MTRRLQMFRIPIMLSLLLTCSVQAADLDEVKQQLSIDIASAQTALSRTQDSISQERQQLARQLNTARNRVLQLREQTAAARRSADEETLSLSQIEARLEQWQTQSDFQSRLLAGFLTRVGDRPAAQTGASALQADLERFTPYLNSRAAALYPDWQLGSLVMPDGQLVTASLLALGPVQWFWLYDRKQGGLTDKGKVVNKAQLLFEGLPNTALETLFETGSAEITFDPTLSRALLLTDDNETLLEHLRKGGIWVVPILLFALFASFTSILKFISLARLPVLLPALADRTETALSEGTISSFQSKVQGDQAQLLHIALQPRSAEQRDEKLFACLLTQRNRLERWLGAIAITASVAPLLGLLGTVSGMIATFKLMTLFGAGDASSVSSGISEALVTTELGLVVAIPALLAHALLSRKVKSYFAQLENDAIYLSQLPLATVGKPA